MIALCLTSGTWRGDWEEVVDCRDREDGMGWIERENERARAKQRERDKQEREKERERDREREREKERETPHTDMYLCADTHNTRGCVIHL